MTPAVHEQVCAEKDVAFDRSAEPDLSAVDTAYHSKYDRYGAAAIVGSVTGDHARDVTIRLVPTDPPV